MNQIIGRISVLSLTILGLGCELAGQETGIVSPSAFAETEAPGVGEISGGSSRVQILYDSADFAVLERPHWITQFAWRLDGAVSGPIEIGSDGDVVFRMSTSDKRVSSMSNVYGENVGPDETVVYSYEGSPGVITVPDPGPQGGPKAFNVLNPLDTPFFYDPNAGSLLLDFDLKGVAPLPADWIPQANQSPTTKQIVGPLGEQSAFRTFGGIVTEFTFWALGDVDQNGSLDVADLDALNAQIRDGGPSGFPFDLDNNGKLNNIDRDRWVRDLKQTWYGDANLDGSFDSKDMLAVFQADEYEDDIPFNSSWSTGDWNGDSEFEAGDLVAAFQDSGYELGPRAAVSAVPEPSAMLLALGFLGLRRIRKHQ